MDILHMTTVKRNRFPEFADERPAEKKKYRTFEDIFQNGPKIENKQIICAPSGNPLKRNDTNEVDNNDEVTTLKRRRRTMHKYVTSSDSDKEENISPEALEHRMETNQNKVHNIEDNVTMDPKMLHLSVRQVLDGIQSAVVGLNLTSEGVDSTLLMEFLLSYKKSFCFKGPLEDLLGLLGYLSISFGPGSSLPSLENLIRIFTRFGQLDMENTKISFETYRARVVFSRASDAKKALIHCMRENPFGNTAVTFHLGFAPSVNGNLNAIEATTVCSFNNGNERGIDLCVGEWLSPKAIAQKQIDRVETMVDSVESNGENWQEMVVKLKAEVKVLREKVDAIS